MKSIFNISARDALQSLASGALQVARRNMSTNYKPGNWMFFGYGNMAKAVIDNKMLQELMEKGNQVDIIKTKPSTGQLEMSGLTYYYSESKNESERMPPLGKKYNKVISGAKPLISAKELGKFSNYVDNNTVLVSYEAGSTTSSLMNRLRGGLCKVIRAMPNTNATIGRSLTAYCTTGNVDEESLDEIVSILQRAGDVFPIAEDRMNAFTAVAGSGPAYAHHILGSISRSLQAHQGYSPKDADSLTLKVAQDFDDPKYKKGVSEKVRNALNQMDSSDQDSSRGKGSTEGIINNAVKALGKDCAPDELDSMIAGVITRVSKSLIKGAQSCGFNEDVSEAMVAGPNGILKASAGYAAKSGKTFLELKNAVTSMDGTTQAALAIGEVGTGRTLDQLWDQAMKAAVIRGKQMGDPLGYSLAEASSALDTAIAQKKDMSLYKKPMAVLYNGLRQVFDLISPAPTTSKAGDNFSAIGLDGKGPDNAKGGGRGQG